MCSPIERRIRDSCRRPPARRGTGSGRYGLSMCSGGSSPARRLDERQHVLLAHAPAAAGARHGVRSTPCSAAIRCDDRVSSGGRLAAGRGRRGAIRRLRRDIGALRRALTGVRGGRRLRRARRRGGRAAAARRDPRQHRARRRPSRPPRRGSRRRRRSTGEGTSVSILSVEISQIVSSAAIGSPTSTRQATTVPSATDTPIWGIVTSTRLRSQ